MPPPRPVLAAVVFGLSLSAACLPGALPPMVPARSTLAIGGEPSPPPATVTGPLAVTFAAPRGETSQAAEIAIVFNKPLRPLGAGPSDPPPPVTLRPPAKGAFHWVGSAALRFDAEEPLAPATAYHVEIPAGTRSLDGSTLADPFVLDFTTPRAKVVETNPPADTREVLPAPRASGTAAPRCWSPASTTTGRPPAPQWSCTASRRGARRSASAPRRPARTAPRRSPSPTRSARRTRSPSSRDAGTTGPTARSRRRAR